MSVTGRSGSLARNQVLKGVRSSVDLQRKSKADAIMRRKRLKISNAAHRARLAKAMDVDFIVWGHIRGKGTSGRTSIRVADRTGKQVSSAQAAAPGTSKRNRDIQTKAKRAVRRALKAAGVTATSQRATLTDTSDASEIEPIDIDIDADQPKPADSPKDRTSSSEADPIATILVGIGGRTRNATITLTSGGKPKYESGVFPELLAHARFFPGAKSSKKGIRGLYLQLDAALGLKLESVVSGGSDKLGTTTYRFSGHFGYLHPFMRAKFGVIAGAGLDEFEIDDNVVLPSTTYVYGRVGLVGQYDLIPKMLYGRIDGGFRYPFSVGDLKSFGSDAKGFGLDAGLSLGGQFEVGFTWMLRFSWERMMLDFGGQAETVTHVGKDGTDDNLLFQALVGWSF